MFSNIVEGRLFSSFQPESRRNRAEGVPRSKDMAGVTCLPPHIRFTYTTTGRRLACHFTGPLSFGPEALALFGLAGTSGAENSRLADQGEAGFCFK